MRHTVIFVAMCSKEESSTGLVRFQACEMNRRGKQKPRGRACWWEEGNKAEVLASIESSRRFDLHDVGCHAPRYRNLFHTVLTFTAHLVHIRMHSKSITFFKKKKSLKDSYSIAEFQTVHTK